MILGSGQICESFLLVEITMRGVYLSVAAQAQLQQLEQIAILNTLTAEDPEKFGNLALIVTHLSQ